MSDNQDDNKIRELFAGIKQADDRQAPAFHAVEEKSQPRPFLAELRYGRLAAAVLIGAGLVAVLSHEWSAKSSIALKPVSPPASKIDSSTEVVPNSIETWQSPTAFLLSEPDEPDPNGGS
ncbi:MAG TPA: hypothetical protein VLJ39_00465, partial [Tepidisphaeraceae bacterium]|nr:hypothetical protein [Tepidisphaeraceae bacterium]